MQRLARIVFKNRFVPSSQDCLTSASPVLLLSLSSRIDASFKDNGCLFCKKCSRFGNDCIWKQYRELSTSSVLRQNTETERHLLKEGSGDFVYSMNAPPTNDFSGLSVGATERKGRKTESKRLKIEKDVVKQFFENESVNSSEYKLFNLTGNYLLDIGSSGFRWGFPLRKKPKSWKPVPRFYASRSSENTTKGTVQSYIANVGEGIQRRTRELVGKLKSIGADSSEDYFWEETNNLCPENPYAGCESSSDYKPLAPMAIHEVPANPLVSNEGMAKTASTMSAYSQQNEAETTNYAMNLVVPLKEPTHKIIEHADQKFWTLMQLFEENQIVNIQPVDNTMLKSCGLKEFFESKHKGQKKAFVRIMKVPVRVSMQEVMKEKGKKSIKYIGQHVDVGLILIGENAEMLGVVPGRLNKQLMTQPSKETSHEASSMMANLLIACMVGLASQTKSKLKVSTCTRSYSSYAGSDERRGLTDPTRKTIPSNNSVVTSKLLACDTSGYKNLVLNMLTDLPKKPPFGGDTENNQEDVSPESKVIQLKEEISEAKKEEIRSIPTFTLVPFDGNTSVSGSGSSADGESYSNKQKLQEGHESACTNLQPITWYPKESGMDTRKPPMNVGTTCEAKPFKKAIQTKASLDNTVIFSQPRFNQTGPPEQQPRMPIVCFPKQKYLVPNEQGQIKYPKPCLGHHVVMNAAQAPEVGQPSEVGQPTPSIMHSQYSHQHQCGGGSVPQPSVMNGVQASGIEDMSTPPSMHSQNSCQTVGPATGYFSGSQSMNAAYDGNHQECDSIGTIGGETEGLGYQSVNSPTFAPSEMSQPPYCDGGLQERLGCECPQVGLRCCPWYSGRPCPPIPGNTNGQGVHCCLWPCNMPCPGMNDTVYSTPASSMSQQSCKCIWPCEVPCPRPPLDLPDWTQYPESSYSWSPSYDSSYGSLYYSTPSYRSTFELPPHTFSPTMPFSTGTARPPTHSCTTKNQFPPIPPLRGAQSATMPTGASVYQTGYYMGSTTPSPQPSYQSTEGGCDPEEFRTLASDEYSARYTPTQDLPMLRASARSTGFNNDDIRSSFSDSGKWGDIYSQADTIGGFSSCGEPNEVSGSQYGWNYSSGTVPLETRYSNSQMTAPSSHYYASAMRSPENQYCSSQMAAPDSQYHATGTNMPRSPYYATGFHSPDSQYYATSTATPRSSYYATGLHSPDSQVSASRMSPPESSYHPSVRTPEASYYASEEGLPDSATYSPHPSGFPPSGHYTPMQTSEYMSQTPMPSQTGSRLCSLEPNNQSMPYPPAYPSLASTTSSVSCMPCIPCPCCPPNPHPYFIPQHEYLQGTIVTAPVEGRAQGPFSAGTEETFKNHAEKEETEQNEDRTAENTESNPSKQIGKLVAKTIDRSFFIDNLPNIWPLACLLKNSDSNSDFKTRDSDSIQHSSKLEQDYVSQWSGSQLEEIAPSVKSNDCSITVSAQSLEGQRKKEKEGEADCRSVSCSEAHSSEEYQRTVRIPRSESSVNSLQVFRTMESVLRKTDSQSFPEIRYADPSLFGVLNDLGISDLNKSSYSGEWVGSGEVVPVIDPATSSCITDVILPTPEEVEHCVGVAKKAADTWSNLQSPYRSVILNEIARRISKKSTQLAKVISLEVGKIVGDAMCEVRGVVRMFEYAAGLASVFAGNIFESERTNHIIMERFLPMGTTGIISAFNTPFSTFGKSASISLAVGNTIVFKPAPTTALSSMALMKIIGETCKAYDLPSVVSCVQGGSDIGKLLADDSRIDIVAFSGSQKNGQEVGVKVQNRFGKSLLNIAGNNSLIVSHDANFELALDAAAIGIIDFAGQKKQKISHIIVHRLLYDQFVEKLTGLLSKTSKFCGNPLDPRSMFGPLHSSKITDRYLAAKKEVLKAGGRIETGGEQLENNFVEPSLVTGVSTASQLVATPTIGPLAFVFPASSLEEAIEINNSFPNRLNSSVFTKNVVDVYRCIGGRGLAGGVISINTANSGTELTVPLGGDKAAGGGRLSGSNVWQEYCRRVAINLNFSSSLPYAHGSSCTHIGGFQIY